MRKLLILLALLFVCSTTVFATGSNTKRVFGGESLGSSTTSEETTACSGYCYPFSITCLGDCQCSGDLACCYSGCSGCCSS
jgi:hypothetical protein